MARYHFVFPRWSNLLLPAVVLVGATAPLYAAFIVAYGFSPDTTDVGYQPKQPIPFSHKIHAGQLGMDCRYCHNTVEVTAKAAIPPTQTCMNCHTQIHPESENLAPLWESYRIGRAVQWKRIHDLA
ncbi:MAG TPA: cytochrome c3 family protein, partial [Phycisphaerales bacterium]|nr:cytochrome c3 family protein [Phycisphaerales bacterium]